MINFTFPTGECMALGFDLGLFFLCRALLRRHREILSEIRAAPKFDSYSELRDNILLEFTKDAHEGAVETDKSIPYAVVEGRVEPMDAAIPSQFVSADTGVIRTFTIKDHKVERSHGLWVEKSANIQESERNVPFKIIPSQDAVLQSAALLRTSAEGVEFRDIDKIDNPLHAELDVVYDKFEPSQAGFGRSLMDNFRGDVSKGIQETEKMLLVGTKVTAIGRVIMKGGNSIQIVYPTADYQFILSKKTHEEIIKGYQEATGFIQIITYAFGATGVFLAGLIAVRLYKEYKERKQYAALLRQLSEQRRVGGTPAGEAGHTQRASDTPDAPAVENVMPEVVDAISDNDAPTPLAQCIVCMTNPRDVILLGCGHVCVCAECAAMLPSCRCPMCRTIIERVQPFFIS